MNNLALLLQDQGQLEEAAPLYRRAPEASERTLGAEHPKTLTLVANPAPLLQHQGQLEEAAAAVPTCAGGARADAGRRSPGHAGLDEQPGVAAAGPGASFEEAAPLFRRALEVRERTPGAESTRTR